MNKNQVKDGVVFSGKSWSYVLRIPDSVTGKTKPKWVGGYEINYNKWLAKQKSYEQTVSKPSFEKIAKLNK